MKKTKDHYQIPQQVITEIVKLKDQGLTPNRIIKIINAAHGTVLTMDQVWELAFTVTKPDLDLAEENNIEEETEPETDDPISNYQKNKLKKEAIEQVLLLEEELAKRNSELRSQLVTPRQSKLKRNSSNNKNNNHISVSLNIGDLHSGKLIRTAHTNGKEKDVFNTEIAEARVSSLFDRTIDYIKEKEISGFVVDELNINLIGDLPDGEIIYKGQNNQIDNPVIRQQRNVSFWLWDGARKVRSELPELTISFKCTPGNHGRVSDSSASAVETNWDNVVYLTLEMFSMLQPELRIEVVYNTLGPLNYYCKGWKVHLRHQGIKEAPTTKTSRSTIGDWYAMHHFDIIVWGHYHDCFWSVWQGVQCFQNGAVGESDDYAEGLARNSFPALWLFTTSYDTPVKEGVKIYFKGSKAYI